MPGRHSTTPLKEKNTEIVFNQYYECLVVYILYIPHKYKHLTSTNELMNHWFNTLLDLVVYVFFFNSAGGTFL